jgi:hypothetical protein
MSHKRRRKKETKDMSYNFNRQFSLANISQLAGDDVALFEQLLRDCQSGEVFPAVRDNELYFYFSGGMLYKLKGTKFWRDYNYSKYSQGVDVAGLTSYEIAKLENLKKYPPDEKERGLLDKLYKDCNGSIVMLDIEVRFNMRGVDTGRKTDLLLLNNETGELMFAEGKVFADNRVNVRIGSTPEVIEQVQRYDRLIAELTPERIIGQYQRFVAIINELFGRHFANPQTIIQPSKLLVYNTPKTLNANGKHSKDLIDAELGADNVMWHIKGEKEPTLAEIWAALCR